MQSRNSAIKKTLAYSLHEVARILAEGQLVEDELVPVFEDMIQDVEVVQMGVIKHLAKFLAMLPELCRVSYLPLLHDILHSTNPFNWRLRRHLANQLPDLVLLPPRQDLYRTLFSTVMILLQDPVASVRTVTFAGVTALINNLQALVDTEVEANGPDSTLAVTYRQHVDDVISAINSFAVGEKYQLRQLWCELCAQLLHDLPRDFFEQNFIQGILTLTCDRVTNVRIALSEFLTNWGDDCLPPWVEPSESVAGSVVGDDLSVDSKEVNAKKEVSPWHWLLRRADIKQCVERLSRDDNDIYLNFTKLAPLYPDIKFSSMSCRGRKAPPGGQTPIAIDASPMVINLSEALSPSEESHLSSLRSDEDQSECVEEAPSSKLNSSRDEHNRSMSSIDIPLSSTSRSRSNSLNVAPIEIEKITAVRPTSGSFAPLLDADFILNPAHAIVADEVDLIEGFMGVDPNEELLLGASGIGGISGISGKGDYDDDEDDEAGAVEEALINAAKEAQALESLSPKEDDVREGGGALNGAGST